MTDLRSTDHAANGVSEPAEAIRWGRASGVGSWPGLEPIEALRVTFGELSDPHIPYLPELPARGPGADMIGRGAALLVDMPVDLQPAGWRLVDRPGADLARAQSIWRRDLDALAEQADGYHGPLKLQLAGPWTLSANLVLSRLERVVVDAGACRDLISSLAEGAANLVADVARLVPGAELTLQLDEPSLPAVLAGALPTASGFGRLRAVDAPVVAQGISEVLQAASAAGARATTVHCCAVQAPIPLLLRVGASGLSVDLAHLTQANWEALGEPVENGLQLWAGVVATTGEIPAARSIADAIYVPWRRYGLSQELLSAVILTPACGLAGNAPDDARRRLTAACDGASALADLAQS